ncbi:hypothetical protein CU110_11820 [Cobetia sp. ICG0124]|nr:hypothetical protein CU110_11820 [Cobetia sp. ICG0124]
MSARQRFQLLRSDPDQHTEAGFAHRDVAGVADGTETPAQAVAADIIARREVELQIMPRDAP